MMKRKIPFTNSAYFNIQDRRSRALVKTPLNGVLHDYVPFYFATRSPILYAHHKQKVIPGFDVQSDLIYLVSNLKILSDRSLNYAFTDGHAAMEISSFYHEFKDLKEIDWNIMRSTNWQNTIEDPDRKRRRQAEFLVKDFFPLHFIQKICVYDKNRKKFVASILEKNIGNSLIKNVFVQKNWYF